MRYQHRLSASLRTIAICLPCLAGGCGFYIHDGDLQTKTAKVLETYQQADVAASMKAALENQKKLDAAEINALVAFDTADRESVLAKLIEPGPPLPAQTDEPPLQLLSKKITQRLDELVGNHAIIAPSDWVNLRERQTLADIRNKDQINNLDSAARAYKRLGGTGFRSCDDFIPSQPLSGDVLVARQTLDGACELLALVQFNPVPSKMVAGENSEVFETNENLNRIKTRLAKEKTAHDEAAGELQAAKDAVDAAHAQQGPAQQAVADSLAKLDEALTRLDGASGLVGGKPVSLGAALATIEFRKTNLRALITAAANPTDDASSGDPAHSMAAIISGLAKLSDIEAGKVPSLAKLSVVLAVQEGLEQAARATLDGLATEQRLLKEKQAGQYREIEMLALAMDSVQRAQSKAAGQCAGLPLGEVLTNGTCSALEPDVARALSAFNLSWASGRRAGKISDRKLTQLIQIQKLRLSQEAAEARSEALRVAMSELATFGAGGVKPETIAAFLQALGLTAVAVGVN